MQAVRQEIHDMVETMPDYRLAEVSTFIQFLKMRSEKKLYSGLEALSMSSTDFWDNEVDDEVWNNV